MTSQKHPLPKNYSIVCPAGAPKENWPTCTRCKEKAISLHTGNYGKDKLCSKCTHEDWKAGKNPYSDEYWDSLT